MGFYTFLGLFLFLVFLIGASLGSFINCAAYRIPLGLSLLKPRSHCNSCKKEIPSLYLFPVFGYFFAKAKCVFCKVKVPLEYPLVETLCGLFLITLTIYSVSIDPKNNVHFINLPYMVTLIWFFFTGVLLSIIDLKHRILPDVITLPGILIGILISSFNPLIGFKSAVLGVLAGGVGLFLISYVYELFRKRQGMGLGDVKYLAFIGASCGLLGVFYALFIASILGALVGLTFIFVKRKGLDFGIPFGPFLALGGFVYLVYFL